MRTFSKEELETLKEYETRLYSAVHSNFARHLSSTTLDRIKTIFESAGGSGFTPNWSCSHCTLAFLKLVGKKYFEDKTKLDLSETKKATEELADKAQRAADLVKALDEVFAEVPDERPASAKAAKKKSAKKNKK